MAFFVRYTTIRTVTQLSLSGLILVGLPFGSWVNAPLLGEDSFADTDQNQITIAESTSKSSGPTTLKEMIAVAAKEQGVEPALALEIAFCESTLRHYNKIGDTLKGNLNQADVGLFQINEDYHLAKSRDLGYDIYTPKGNIDYAIWLIKNEGVKHWRSSYKCWG